MERLTRLLGILLYLRTGQPISARELARRFEVSTRTIYRDLEIMSAAGIPFFAERGRAGGVRLVEGYFLPPLMFARDEAIALLLGLALLRGLKATPFPAALEKAEKKLLAVLPEKLQATLTRTEKIIGFEKLPADLFHPEPASELPSPSEATGESETIGLFLQAILDSNAVKLCYRSPYRPKASEVTAEALGLFWDRDHWYLAGRLLDRPEAVRVWRSDRVLDLKSARSQKTAPAGFDVRTLLGHTWLREAMDQWRQNAPIKIRLTPAQAETLQQDWYYRHARFEQVSPDRVVMTIGEEDPALVMKLVRWLGPGAELLEPAEWRETIREELKKMLECYPVN